jgi:hypothetical protein
VLRLQSARPPCRAYSIRGASAMIVCMIERPLGETRNARSGIAFKSGYVTPPPRNAESPQRSMKDTVHERRQLVAILVATAMDLGRKHGQIEAVPTHKSL